MGPRTAPALVLGTAQWGLDYGVTNNGGRLTDEAVRSILDVLDRMGIGLLDTAPAYGDAEARIGKLAAGVAVQTKVPGVGDLRAHLVASSVRLTRRPMRLLLHDWPTLDAEQRSAAARVLEQLRSEGLVDMVGISGYDAADLAAGFETFERLDLAQLPVSVLDQRLAGSPEIAALRSGGGLLQARSVYLQGLAMSVPGQAPLADHPHLERLRSWCAAAGIDAASACRSYVRSQPWIDEIVVGVTSADELLEWDDAKGSVVRRWDEVASDDAMLLDPRSWSTAERAG